MPKHAETRTVPYTAAQMYALVADVAAYPKFLPWCAAARIRSERETTHGTEMLADLVISFKVFREKFGSRVCLDPSARRIQTEYLDGPFRHMQSEWEFTDLEGGGCRVDFETDFEFKTKVLQGLIGLVFHEAMQRIVRAFETRADALYGPDTAVTA